MSLRQRLVFIVCLALSALGSAGLAIADVLARSDQAREASGWSSSEAAVEALARGYGERARTGGSDADHERLETIARAVVGALPDSSVGYCSRAAITIQAASSGLHPGPPHPALPPDQSAAVVEACARAPVGATTRARLVHPHDVVAISVKALGEEAAWALVRVPTHPDDPRLRWPAYLVVTALATLVLVITGGDALLALHRGTDELDAAVARLQVDLRAAVPRPRARELARLAESLHTMALHLADARDRERSLEQTVAHQQRLAALGRVVAGVAHEVRNPLTGIKLKLDAMGRRRLDARSERDVAVCLGEVARLDRVVQSLLVVARRAPASAEPIDLGALADERIVASTELAAAQGVTLSRTGEARTDADRDALARVLDNLLHNAIEASPRGASVEVLLEGGDAEPRITVVDHGDGIPADRAVELFEPFFTMKPEGTGLGLWLSRVLVEAHRGTLTYDRRSSGTRFTVTLPQEPSHADATRAPDRR